MIFEIVCFIKPCEEQEKEFTGKNFAPMFRRKFDIKKTGKATLYVCGLGFGYYYLNGKHVSNDLFTAPVSNYCKTLWYNKYDVTELLCEGENIASVWCGNGWYNEDFTSSWSFDKAEWRDVPKFIMRLEVDGKTVLCSDELWRYTLDTPIWFNALRSGEYFDARKYNSEWTALHFDDSSWKYALADDNTPKGEFRECVCEPIREFEEYKTVDIKKVSDSKYIFDIGQNISGYIRLTVKGYEGQLLTIRYAEQINDDLSLQLNNMKKHYPQSEFQTDKLICSGEYITWSPRFCYHGFRYIEIEGLTNLDDVVVSGVFVHQAVEKRTEFECSNELLNKMFKAGIYSVYSNMFYALTDCPTREKLGWTNDAQSSAEQIMTNFKAEKFFDKWLQDIRDAMREDGSLSGIIPTAGWGYHWGNGPVSDGTIFELPYRIYLHTGNKKPLIETLPYFKRYFEYIKTRTDEDGFVRFGLYDWAKPGFDADADIADVPLEFINALLIMNFYNIAALAQSLSGKDGTSFKKKAEEQKELVMSNYIDKSGYCTVNKQTAVAMLIYYDVYNELEPLAEQLKVLIEEYDFHHDCGMVGLRRLYIALNKCGLEEYAYKVITVKGYPSYSEWFNEGATTLWEYWDWFKHDDSKNHHMYSDFMSWIVKTILGINQTEVGFKKVSINPYFFKELEYAKGSCNTCSGKISVEWRKSKDNIMVEIDIPEGICAEYRGIQLQSGKNQFTYNK